MFTPLFFPNDYFVREYWPASGVTVFKNLTMRDGLHVGDQKFSNIRTSFSWNREKDAVPIKEVNHSWTAETGKLPPR